MGTLTPAGWRDLTGAYVEVFSKATKAGALLTGLARVWRQGQRGSRQRVCCTGRDLPCLHTSVPNVLFWVMFIWMCCELLLLSGCRGKLISVWFVVTLWSHERWSFCKNIFLSFPSFHCIFCSFCHSAIRKSMSLVWAAVPSGESLSCGCASSQCFSGSILIQLTATILSFSNLISSQNLIVFKGSVKRVQEEEQAVQRVLAIASWDTGGLSSWDSETKWGGRWN